MHATLIVGFILGLLSAFFFACYMLPQKLVKIDGATFLWTMGLGVLMTSLTAYLIAGCPHHANWTDRGAGLLCGLVWGLGTTALSAAISRIGLALATPIKNTTGVIGALEGLIFFQEWRTTNPWLCTLGSALIVAAAILIGMTGNRESPRRVAFTGILFSIVAALCYASYLYPMKIAVRHIGNWEFTPWMALGIVITTSLAAFCRPNGLRISFGYPRRFYLLALLGGTAWALALFCLAASMVRIDLSVAWSLAQLNTVPAVLFGIFLFREVHLPTHRVKLALGLLAATVGTILLGFAK